MRQFYLGRVYTVRFDVDELVHSWLLEENPDLCTWIADCVSGTWDLTTELDFYEYDSAVQAINVFIVYNSAHDALLHRLRWS